MKHAGAETLGKLQPFLKELRQYKILKERSRGIFYLKSKAFLHFHEDPSGIFVDVKLDGKDFSRYRVTTRKEQKEVLKRINDYLTT